MHQIAWLVVLAASAQPAPDGQQAAGPNCGVVSVIALAEALGRPLDEAARTALLAKETRPSVSLADVHRLAAAEGLVLQGFRATLDELAARSGPFIAHLTEPDHFVTVVGIDAHWVQVLDGWYPRLTAVARADLAAHFSGACLLPRSPGEGGPRLALSACHVGYDEGVAGDSVQHTFTVTNRGDQPLHLTAQASSCTCTTVTTEFATIAPGASAPVEVTLRLVPGENKLEFIRLGSDDPGCPVVFLSIGVRYVPHGVRVSPACVSVVAEPGVAARTRFAVSGPSDMQLTGALTTPDIADVRIVDWRFADERRAFVLELVPAAALPCGEHAAVIHLETNLPGAEGIAVPLVVKVVPVALAEPSRIAELRLPPGPFERAVLLRPAGGVPYRILDTATEGLPVQVSDREALPNGRYRIVLSGDIPEGRWRGRLVIRLDCSAQPEVEVPITLAAAAR